MNIHIKRELDKWKISFEIFYVALIPPAILFGIGYLIYIFPLISLIIGPFVVIHILLESYVKKSFKNFNKDAAVGGEDYNER